MDSLTQEEQLRRDYLLGNLNAQTREQVEERLLDDNDFFDQLSMTEDQLIDDYVYGVLSASERDAFDRNFVINDERRRKLKFAQSLDIYLDKIDSPQPVTPIPERWSFWVASQQLLRSYKFWIAVPALVILFLITPRVVRWLQTPDPITLARETRARIEREIAELNQRGVDQQQPARDMTLETSSVLRESGGIKRVVLSPDIKLLRLKLTVPALEPQKYRALVSTVEGAELFGIDNLQSETEGTVGVVRLQLLTKDLAIGDYQIQLTRADDLSAGPMRYYFGVTR
jgi:hypothetical protein